MPNFLTSFQFTQNQYLYLLIVASLLIFLFSLWFEGKRDGFDAIKIFDLSFICLFAFVLLIKYGLIISLVASVVLLVVLAKVVKWSIYRLLDIFSLSFSLGISVFFAGKLAIFKDTSLYLVGFVLAIVFYILFSNIRNRKIPSGFLFLSFTVIFSAASFLLDLSETDLLFYFILITIGILVLISKRKTYMVSSNLPQNLVEFLKSKLTRKDKELKDEQKLLIEEDPYLVKGRDTGNAEEMDEALLEDSAKEINDLQKGVVSNLRIQVRKALTKMKLGSYGICEICKKPIDKARLKAYPEATTCIECASKKQ